jgi:hypothetical protein
MDGTWPVGILALRFAFRVQTNLIGTIAALPSGADEI